MTQEIWEKILFSFNEEMARKNRKVILFIDNAAPHKQTDLSHVRVEYLPPNTTPIAQPLDQ